MYLKKEKNTDKFTLILFTQTQVKHVKRRFYNEQLEIEIIKLNVT